MASSNRDGRRGGTRAKDGQTLARPESQPPRASVAQTGNGAGASSDRLQARVGHLDQLRPEAEKEFAELVRRQLALIGEDPDREGLVRTPSRVARSFAWLTRGYSDTPQSAVGAGVFAEAHDHMVMVRDIELYSLCEHHLLPFFGKAHIAYIPNGKIVGLSKLPRLVEVFARRLQVQERLTAQIAEAVEEVLAPRGVGVVIEAMHLCMMMRGVEKQNSKTITSALLGSFRDDAKTRDEFLRLAHARL